MSLALLLCLGPVQDDPLDALVASLRVPAGLEVAVWAHPPQLANPTSLDVDDRGLVYLLDRFGGMHIVERT